VVSGLTTYGFGSYFFSSGFGYYYFLGASGFLTRVITTRKSFYLTPIVLKTSVLFVALPLKTIFCDYTSNAFSALIFSFKFRTYIMKVSTVASGSI